MIKSMTGFGKAECVLKDKKVFIEIRTLNNKQIDVNAKLPQLYKNKEIDIRNRIIKQLLRGKLEVLIYYELNEGVNPSVINQSTVVEYYRQLSEIADGLNTKLSEQVLESILRLPDALQTERNEVDDEEWNTVISTLDKAINNVDKFREQEGAALQIDIERRVNTITDLLSQVPQYEGERTEKVRDRISANLKEFVQNDNVDKNRFEQEIIYYLERFDITEEKVRLKNHCKYFIETINSRISNGKKLGFISQEMGREINTIGSKANHTEIQRLVVQMKDELEKIKEQILNVL